MTSTFLNYEVNYKLWDWNSKVWQSLLWHTMSLLWNKNVKLWESQKWRIVIDIVTKKTDFLCYNDLFYHFKFLSHNSDLLKLVFFLCGRNGL